MTQVKATPVRLKEENALLKRRLKALESCVLRLEATLPKEQVIILREITREQAKEEIKQLFFGGKTLYFSDIAQKLSLDLELVVDICRELLKKGEIQVGDKTS